MSHRHLLETTPAWDVFDSNCPTRQVLDCIADKWTVLVIRRLADGTLRFAQLRRAVDGISEGSNEHLAGAGTRRHRHTPYLRQRSTESGILAHAAGALTLFPCRGDLFLGRGQHRASAGRAQNVRRHLGKRTKLSLYKHRFSILGLFDSDEPLPFSRLPHGQRSVVCKRSLN